MDIERLALNVPAAYEPPVYLVAKTIPSVVCVRDNLAKEVERTGCIGVVFWTLEEWRNPTRL